MVTIYDLPDELLSEIVNQLDTYRRFQSYGWTCNDCEESASKNPVLNFCRVSKRFLHVGEPVLYSFFANYTKDDEQGHRSRRRFLKRIIERPDLAARVSEVYIGDLEERLGLVTRVKTRNTPGEYSGDDSDDDDDYHEYYDQHEDYDFNYDHDGPINSLNAQEDVLTFTSAAHQVDMPNKSNWLEDLRAGRPDAELALLLAQARNLKTLGMDLPDKDDYDFQYRNFHALLSQVAHDVSAGKKTGPLCALRTLEINYDCENVYSLGVPVDYLRHFFYLPSLREFRGDSITTSARYTDGWGSGSEGDSDAEDDPFALVDNSHHSSHNITPSSPAPGPAPLPWPTHTSPLTHLTLTTANLTHHSTALLLASPRALTTFSAHWSHVLENPRQSHRTTSFHPPTLLSSLVLHAPTLTHLTLHATYAFTTAQDLPGPREDLPRIGDLRPLTHLRTLDISALLLVGSLRVRRLPVTLGKGQQPALRRAMVPPDGGGYAAAADVFPASLERLVVANEFHWGREVRYLEPLLVEVARVVAGGGKLPALREIALEGGWGAKVGPEKVAEVVGLMEGCGVELVVEGRSAGRSADEAREGAERAAERERVLEAFSAAVVEADLAAMRAEGLGPRGDDDLYYY